MRRPKVPRAGGGTEQRAAEQAREGARGYPSRAATDRPAASPVVEPDDVRLARDPTAWRRRPRTSPEEALKRQATLAKLLESNVPMPDVVRTMRKQFPTLGERMVRKLVGQTYDAMVEDDGARGPHLKRLQLRRLMGYIVAARQPRQEEVRGKGGEVRVVTHPPNWGAVANLERLYAQVAGTLEPVEVHSNVNVDVRESIAMVLEHTPADRLVMLAERARAVRAAAPAMIQALPAARAS